MSYKVETVIKNAVMFGESPHWDHLSQSLLYVDFLSGHLHKYNTITRMEELRHFVGTTSFIIPRKSGGYVIGNNLNISHVDWATGDLSILESVDSGTRNILNDGKCDEAGRLWTGTLGDVLKPDPELEKGSIYSLDTNLQIQKHVDKITLSNGVAWTNDNTKMYWVDSLPGGLIYSFTFDLNTGSISKKQVLVKWSEEHPGTPDGMTIDLHDKLWVACFKGSSILRLDQETGQEISRIELPTSQITCCCWGGLNLDELYVTTGRRQIDEVEAGSLLKVTGLGVKGKPANVFLG